MSRHLIHIIYRLPHRLLHAALLLFVLLTLHAPAWAQTDTIRYVREDGEYNNDGRSWASAKNSLQDAINDLHEYLIQNNLLSGSVYVAAGTYVPTESTEASGGTILNTSFKVYAGIHIYGGFDATNPEDAPEQRIMDNGKTWTENRASVPRVGVADAATVSGFWKFKNITRLSGNHSSEPASFVYDAARGRYTTVFPASSFHVVWFATNGEIEVDDASATLKRHFRPLERKAWIDGCTISDGHANNRNTLSRMHTSYGGGAYMVGNSVLQNCVIERCAASIRGGGVYMDGGGRMEHCYVNTCQVTGVGIVQGYGGGVCIDYDGSVEHSYITQSSARIGGGLSICHVPGEYPWQERGDAVQISRYSPFCNASVISNNTSTAEGGGVYLDEGGTINHCTITRNTCIGPDVIYYNRRHGRSGGVYIRNCGLMYNSVCWGSTCPVNNDLQFASIKQSNDPEDLVSVYHCAFMNHDITDWSGVQKEQVYNLEKQNMPIVGSNGNFPAFANPTLTAGIIAAADGSLHADSIRLARDWHPRTISAMVEKGVQVTDAIQGVSEWIRHAHTTNDVVGNRFEPVSTLGALVRENEQVTYALVETQSREADGTLIPTIFVDPNRVNIDEGGNYLLGVVGNSWDAPLANMGDAVNFFRDSLVQDPAHPEATHYHVNGADYPAVQILVKAGVLTTAGPNNYLGDELRTASVRLISNMRLYAAYPPSLTGVSTTGRNPREYTTRITANITGGTSERDFANHSAHVVTFVNTRNAIVDGFRLYEGNAHNLTNTYSVAAGAGVLVNNRTTAQADRIDMTGNQLRNCVIANSFAPKGGAIYVNGEWPKADGELSRAELLIENCVVRNCTSDTIPDGKVANFEDRFRESHGVITSNGNAHIYMNHCTIANNVGHALKTDNAATETDIPLPHTGTIEVYNTAIFANSFHRLTNRDNIVIPMSVNGTHVVNPDGSNTIKNDNITGDYNLLDRDILGMPSGFGPNSEAIFTLHRGEKNYPVFVNPSGNVGHSYDDDKPLYGGIVSYMPMNTNPMVNRADPASASGKDRSDVLYRNYGGAPDVGAIENTNLPKAGTVFYVTPEGAGKREGSSWGNAIAGNTVYALYGAGAARTDQLDGDRIITASGDPVLTTDSTYAGGYAESYFTSKTIGGKTTETKTKTWTTEVNIYEGGERAGESDTLQSRVLTETATLVTTAAGTADGSFTPGWHADDRFP
ncbi:MAG: hypothetical protein IJ680_04530 [Paludibacteraceae bacterium]|nr:hypothetical protein [Paludibacteraceae bacterium]